MSTVEGHFGKTPTLPDAKPLVIAGNYNEFREWCTEKGFTHTAFIYLSHTDVLRGQHGNPVIRIGTWWTNPWRSHVVSVPTTGEVLA